MCKPVSPSMSTSVADRRRYVPDGMGAAGTGTT